MDLFDALHPEPRKQQDPDKRQEAATGRLVQTLVEAASHLRTDCGKEPVPTNLRPSPALRRRLEAGANHMRYPFLNPYLVDVLTSLHPDPETHPEAAVAAAELVKALLQGASVTVEGEQELQGTLDFDLPPVLTGNAVVAA
ncbi:hypothetical protein [Nonomuraea zeae]|uniref:Uncharacterized protein n=1 Tax=Nonomuraea zeae TaxID=1642303 RepID=A0A5S4G8Y6_9ACTN|nr:hypothetical protein [Nonomuraea zeae]TMR29478.1 hypothetical protein ETD85_32305 [Nonomuraea zeae]